MTYLLAFVLPVGSGRLHKYPDCVHDFPPKFAFVFPIVRPRLEYPRPMYDYF